MSTQYRSDEVALNLIFDREASHGRSVRFQVPETKQYVWLAKSQIKIEDNPVQGLLVDIICKRWLAEKEGLI
jgi:hypothetical protein